MTDPGEGPRQSSPCEQQPIDTAAPGVTNCVVTFAVTGGIFGVGQLATRLNKLLESGQIGVWHIGPWVDWRHTAIRIKFASVEDGKLSADVVRLGLQGAPS